MERLLTLPDLGATERLAQCLAPHLNAGDVLLLSGEIGAGKTSFARALIRERAGTEIEVPSPTFTLVQTYADSVVEIWHADLYRLGDPGEIAELGLEEALNDAICLIEWPERMDADLPSALRLTFEAGDPSHHVTLRGSEAWLDRIGPCLD